MNPCGVTLQQVAFALVVFAALLLSLPVDAQNRPKPEPTHKDVAYGPHERNVLDFWQAKSEKPTPLVLFIHGGGFAAGSKENLKATDLHELLDAGVSVAAVNYRYYQQAPLPAALHDCRRALQFVRSKAAEWNIDRTRAGAFGGSAGAVISMYLAFHDDMADPASDDSVARESTRLTAVATTAGQTTLDTQWWAENVPGWPKEEGVRRDGHAYRRWGCSEADFPALIAEGSALRLITRDDPPIWMSYGMSPGDPVPTDPKAATNWKVHNVAFGVALKERMDALGIEAHLAHPNAKTEYQGVAHFLRVKLTGAAGRSTVAAPSPVFAQAARGVEAHRKGDASIRVVRKDGAAVPGARIEIIQRTHDFRFGNVFRPRHYTDEKYRARFLEIFNFVQLLEFNWGQYEIERGKPMLADRMGFINGWCRENGLTRFYGHMLVWASDVKEDFGTQVPAFVLERDTAAQYELLKQRIQREVRAYRNVDIVWDVVNEAVHCRRWGDWEKKGYTDEPIPDVVPYVRDAFQWASEGNPQAPLLLNDYRVIPENRYRDRYIELIASLQKEKVPLHAIGIQAHDPYKGAYWFSPEEIWETCEQFGTKAGLPIYFTEFCYLSDPAKEIRGLYRQGKWSPELQADAIEEFYRVAFGHPAVEAIIYFGMGDDDPPWLPSLCLLDRNSQPKPAWSRLKKLIKEEWNTRQSGTADAEGAFGFRGFFGEYEVRVMAAGRQRSFATHLQKGKPNDWRFTLDDE